MGRFCKDGALFKDGCCGGDSCGAKGNVWEWDDWYSDEEMTDVPSLGKNTTRTRTIRRYRERLMEARPVAWGAGRVSLLLSCFAGVYVVHVIQSL